jgi:eukaryotic-like serine/threonine-protein kinase
MIGRLISGRYRVVGHLGTGGMADVWRAEDEVLGRSVAVKVLHPQYASEENFVARFRQEAQAAANLSHPGIVNVYDWGREEGTYFIVMEFLPGQTLKQLLEERGNLRPERALEITRDVAAALSYAHKNNIVHRDIKPHNIMIGPTGSVKVTDFGIAHAGGSQLTQTGSVMGTAQYLSPEQAQGRETGPGTDVYSLGVVLYEMLTGNVPFDGDNPVSVALKHVNEAPVSPRVLNPNVPPDLERIVLKAMAKQPEQRYRSIEEMAADLDRAAEGAPLAGAAAGAANGVTQVLAPVSSEAAGGGAPSASRDASRPPTGRPGQAERKRGANTWIWVAVVAVLILAAAGIAWAIYASSLPKPVQVPNVVGQSYQAAQQQLAGLKLKMVVASQTNNDTMPAGQVISQDPLAGIAAKEGDTVKVVVSLGKASVAVGSYIGLAQQEAMRQITLAGLVVGALKPQTSDTYNQGTVMSQDPAAGASVPKGTTVDLVVSQGKAMVTVPNVKQMTKKKAIAKLAEYGLGASVRSVFSDAGTGTVVAQDPEEGADVTSGTVVTIDVSKGPELVKVPNVVGSGQDTATAALEAEGFVVSKDVSVTGDPTQWDNVVTQDPPANSLAKKGSTVTIYVGKKP